MHHGVADPCADAPTPPDRGRRLWCDNPACVGAVFCERLPSAWAGLRQCRTIAVREHLITWRWTASAADVARVAAHQGLPVSADTVIRARHAEPDPPTDAVRVLVVDEWALRKGRTYATILIDQERHRTVDVLPHDQSGTRRPGSRPIPRSRSGLGTGTRRSPKYFEVTFYSHCGGSPDRHASGRPVAPRPQPAERARTGLSLARRRARPRSSVGRAGPTEGSGSVRAFARGVYWRGMPLAEGQPSLYPVPGDPGAPLGVYLGPPVSHRAARAVSEALTAWLQPPSRVGFRNLGTLSPTSAGIW